MDHRQEIIGEALDDGDRIELKCRVRLVVGRGVVAGGGEDRLLGNPKRFGDGDALGVARRARAVDPALDRAPVRA
jgi:hypothetical protein